MKKLILFAFIATAFIFNVNAKTYHFLVGTFTHNSESKGIYDLTFNSDSMKTEIHQTGGDVADPSFLTMTKDKKFVYSVNETEGEGDVSAFKFDSKTGNLTLLNKVKAGGGNPCYITVSDHHVITANYATGNVCVFYRNPDGSLSDVVQNIQHVGKSINPDRQAGPHVHQTIFSPDGKFLLVNDLGTDYIESYKFNDESYDHPLTPYDSLKVKPGSGPRHLTFSKDGKYIYLLAELKGTLTTIAYNNGKLTKVAETTVVRKKDVKVAAAEIFTSPDGKFLYASDRGTANDITCFKIGDNDMLTYVDQISSYGFWPRNFVITHDGKYLLSANQNCELISFFKRDSKTGKLTYLDMSVDVGAPVCVIEY